MVLRGSKVTASSPDSAVALFGAHIGLLPYPDSLSYWLCLRRWRALIGLLLIITFPRMHTGRTHRRGP
ncbi:hypothetical protein L083_4305 [Actinoplanes sp. N902-109]|nr:hypothetical protein L083_4305 [Actinoplanes sp. N902-109]